MLPNPFTEVGRVYSELQSLEHKVNSKAYEVSELKHQLQQVKSEITFLCNEVHRVWEVIDEINRKLNEEIK
jgi:peptidoglycan hydrolase CwlO-like protein